MTCHDFGGTGGTWPEDVLDRMDQAVSAPPLSTKDPG